MFYDHSTHLMFNLAHIAIAAINGLKEMMILILILI